jgi:hypothetical protein
VPTAELPDGIFSNQKSQIGLFLEGIAMEDDLFNVHLAIWYNLWPICIINGHLVWVYMRLLFYIFS